MLASIITTVVDFIRYEIWQEVDGTETSFKAIRYDGELGTARTVAVEWKEDHARRMVRYDMANLGIA